MKNLSDLELLATVENLRRSRETMSSTDETLRIATAIIANACGYKSRSTWVDVLRRAGLIVSCIDPEEEAAESKALYKDLMEKMEACEKFEVDENERG